MIAVMAVAAMSDDASGRFNTIQYTPYERVAERYAALSSSVCRRACAVGNVLVIAQKELCAVSRPLAIARKPC